MKLLSLTGYIILEDKPLCGGVDAGIWQSDGTVIQVELGFVPTTTERSNHHLSWAVRTHWSESQGERHFVFRTVADRDLFDFLLKKADGVGPAVAVALLQHAGYDGLKKAVETNDAAALAKQCQGVGKKTAESVIRALTGVISTSSRPSTKPAAPDQRLIDARSALMTMGYKAAEAVNATKELTVTPTDTAETLIKQALRKPRNPTP